MRRHQQEDHSLAEQIQTAYVAHREVYGSPRLYVELQNQGIRCRKMASPPERVN
ncbi:IS3 family transposase [Dictyobacter kobayashii]|uniref:IS3 family transposase n=1 Tax=Dictyobacter kobayashii TaxID=2014872 RepID=UPI0035311BF0